MNLAELVAFGERLDGDLEAAAERYNVRSDLRTILEYESMTVSAYVRLLVHGVPVPDDLRKSVLLGEWGRGYSWDEDELLQRVAEFYRVLQEHGVSTG